MIRFILSIVSHPLVFAAGVVAGALIGWAGLKVLWRDALAAAKKA